MKCEVCHRAEAVGVFASAVANISFAYCEECLHSDREPYGILAIYLMGCSSMIDVAPWVRPIVRATLEAEGKTEEEFFQDIQKGRDRG